jgi:hypothetical protein
LNFTNDGMLRPDRPYEIDRIPLGLSVETRLRVRWTILVPTLGPAALSIDHVRRTVRIDAGPISCDVDNWVCLQL